MGMGFDGEALQERLLEQLKRVLDAGDWERIIPHLESIWVVAVPQLEGDLQAYAKRDPAAHGCVELILDTYSSFKAVLFHRFAHQIWLCDSIEGYECLAHKLANAGKLLSGAEIHPAAHIGQRFVLDHGYGTVIGETSEIGDDCYLLGGVTLGALGIADNHSGKRHPTLGDCVEIGAGVRILGAVTVGDNVFVSPACVITRDVPDNCRVSIVNQLQIGLGGHASDHRYISAYASGGYVHLVGELPSTSELSVLDTDHRPLDWLSVQGVAGDCHHQQYRICQLALADSAPKYPMNLRLSSSGQDITLIDPPGLTSLVRSLVQPVSLRQGV